MCVFVCGVGGIEVHKDFLLERGLLTRLYERMVTVGYSSALSQLDEADIFMYSSQLVCSVHLHMQTLIPSRLCSILIL